LSAAVVAIIDGETYYAKNASFFFFPRRPLKLQGTAAASRRPTYKLFGFIKKRCREFYRRVAGE